MNYYYNYICLIQKFHTERTGKELLCYECKYNQSIFYSRFLRLIFSVLNDD